MLLRGKFIVLGVLALAALAVIAGYFSISPTRNGNFLVAAFFNADGEAEGWAYRFSLSDFVGDGVMSRSELAERRIPGIPSGSMMQWFCSSSAFSGVVMVGGKPWAFPESARAYVLGDGFSPEPVSASSEYRFRDCGFWNTVSDSFFATVSHGSWTLSVRSLWSGKIWTERIPFVSQAGLATDVALGHFLEFADLDSDGDDEIYVSVTSPFGVSSGSVVENADGKIYRAEFTGDWWKMGELAFPGDGYSRRLKASRSGNGNTLLALYERPAITARRSTAPSVALYEYSKTSDSGTWKRLAEFAWHAECKTLTDFEMDGSDLQVGCDGPALYQLRRNGEGAEIVRKLSFELPQNERTDATAMELRPWERRSIHSVDFADRDGDGFSELVVGVNNDGLYLVDRKNPDSRKRLRFQWHDGNSGKKSDGFFLIMDAVSSIGDGEALFKALRFSDGATPSK